MDLDHLLRQASEDGRIGDLVRQVSVDSGDDLADALDRVAVALAERFLAGTIDFPDADKCANGLWGLMVDEGIFPPLVESIFSAFDEGEYHHREDSSSVDPVQKYTVPHLRQLLAGRS